MKYGSKYTALRVDAQGPDPILHPHTGAVIGHKKSLVAEFGILGNEYVARDDDGEPLYRDANGGAYTSVDIRGKYWDSLVAQEQNGWTDEEREAVEQVVDFFCRQQPDMVWHEEPVKVLAPWPTFDTQDDKNAVAFAIEGGMVEHALAYAVQEKRKKVVTELQAYLAAHAEADKAASELTAAI